MSSEERIIELLEEMVAWSRLMARDRFVDALRHALTDPKHFEAYRLTDGSRTQKEVGNAVGLSQPAVSGLWQKWRRLGIAVENNGSTAHLVNPADIGVTLDDIVKS